MKELAKHRHTCDMCGLEGYLCRRNECRVEYVNMCANCEAYEYGDMDCYRVGVEDAE